jgi:hypothetical protein
MSDRLEKIKYQIKSGYWLATVPERKEGLCWLIAEVERLRAALLVVENNEKLLSDTIESNNALRSALSDSLRVMEECEWRASGTGFYNGAIHQGVPYCVACTCTQKSGHAKDCKLSAQIERLVECGSETPVKDYRCARCASARIHELESELAESKSKCNNATTILDQLLNSDFSGHTLEYAPILGVWRITCKIEGK